MITKNGKAPAKQPIQLQSNPFNFNANWQKLAEILYKA